MIQSAYLVASGLEAALAAEIPGKTSWHGHLLLSEEPAIASRWAQNIWLEPETLAVESIKGAAQALSARQRNWWPYLHLHPRRAKLIQEALPHVSGKRVVFPPPAALPQAPALGSWTLLTPNLVLASAACSSPRPNGMWEFEEDRSGPPNRAYLKLWEIFSRLGLRPRADALCIDVGASPGGWSWVLGKLGARVWAFDRSPLEARVLQNPSISFREGDAFKTSPKTHPEAEWIFSDLICYPEKLYHWVELWLADSRPRNFICTIKFQGQEHYPWIENFARISGSQLIHLYHNKHELTWVCLRDQKSVQAW